MKLYQVIIILSSLLLTNCASNRIQTVKETQQPFIEIPSPVLLGESHMWTAPGMLWNHIQYLRFNLNKEEKNLHQSAVFHALNNARDGEITSWYSKKRIAKGKVRVVHSYPTSDGLCRTYQSFITLNGASRHLTNNACKRLNNNWKFLE
jgi:surface antigen